MIEWNLVSMKRQLFFAFIRETHTLPVASLRTIVANKAHSSPRYRAAALRNLMQASPSVLTQGRPFAEKRRIVRLHYGV